MADAVKLTDLNPIWCGAGGEGITRADPTTGKHEPVPKRDGVGIILDCPCRRCGELLFVPFANPLDGGPNPNAQGWKREGDTFETLTLTPSILRTPAKGGCGWHGYITRGEVTSC